MQQEAEDVVAGGVAGDVGADLFDHAGIVRPRVTGYSCSTPMPASIPAAMELSTGLADDACTRTSTSRGPGVGVARSAPAAGGVPASLSVMAIISWVSAWGWRG